MGQLLQSTDHWPFGEGGIFSDPTVTFYALELAGGQLHIPPSPCSKLAQL